MIQLSKKAAIIICVIVLAVLFIMALVIINSAARISKMEQASKVEKVTVQYQNVLNTDSLKTAIERTVFDSLRAVRLQFQNELKSIRNENATRRAQSVDIRTRYDHIFIDRPDF